MKKLVMIAAVMSMFGSVVFAEQQMQATVVGMQETYRDVVKQVPVESCQVIDVPIYREVVTGGASTGDVLAGAIIGGVIGNQFGNGSGKDAMTVLGAIVGADSMNKKGHRETVIVGYRQEKQCSTVYKQQQVSVRGDNLVTVEIGNGQQFQFYTKDWYKVGSIVYLSLSIS